MCMFTIGFFPFECAVCVYVFLCALLLSQCFGGLYNLSIFKSEKKLEFCAFYGDYKYVRECAIFCIASCLQQFLFPAQRCCSKSSSPAFYRVFFSRWATSLLIPISIFHWWRLIFHISQDNDDEYFISIFTVWLRVIFEKFKCGSWIEIVFENESATFLLRSIFVHNKSVLVMILRKRQPNPKRSNRFSMFFHQIIFRVFSDAWVTWPICELSVHIFPLSNGGYRNIRESSIGIEIFPFHGEPRNWFDNRSKKEKFVMVQSHYYYYYWDRENKIKS